ncbi:MAG: hypothetical protein M3R53_03280 [Candidatus Eremiobacteraeota bacterium]|nr:hypothetical protein [Candidatus Eremiobacteraeota bacterium]
MQMLFRSLWQGALNGTQTRTREEALLPGRYGFSGSFAQALYWFGFEVANIVVYGGRR